MQHDPSVWVLLFDQTPPLIRWILALLTGGLFLLARYIWLRQQERLRALEIANKALASREELEKLTTEVKSNNRVLHEKVDKILFHMLRD